MLQIKSNSMLSTITKSVWKIEKIEVRINYLDDLGTD